jgi:excisionase family DNA binding protein
MSGEAPTENMVGIPRIAQLLDKSPDTIYRMVHAGDIPGFKVGGEWRFFESAVIAHFQTPKSDPWAQSTRSRSRRRVA